MDRYENSHESDVWMTEVWGNTDYWKDLWTWESDKSGVDAIVSLTGYGDEPELRYSIFSLSLMSSSKKQRVRWG